MRVRLAVAGLCALTLLAACEREIPLEGERLPLRAALDGTDPSAAAGDLAADGPVPFAVPAAVNLSDWTHRGANTRHSVSNPALSAVPQLVWTANIGAGDSRKHRITADPVVAGSRVFTMDSRATVAATSTGGEPLWSTTIAPASDREDDASGGGLATDGTRVYVTSGFGRLTALDAATGAEIWTQRLGAAATSAPTVSDGTVFAVSTDSRGWAIDAETGRIEWEVTGAPSPAGVLGGGAPAVTDRLVLLPFHSGDMVAVLKQSGLRVWNAPVSGRRPGRVFARFTDVTGDPVVTNDLIYAGNPGGRSMAIDPASGDRVWTAREGALSPIWVAGGSAFLISDLNELVRLDAATGERIWGTQLPFFERDRPRRREAIFDHYGPILAGGRLIVASGDGQLRLFDPATGAALGAVPIPGGASSLPAVVNGTLYVVSSRGQLHAFR